MSETETQVLKRSELQLPQFSMYENKVEETNVTHYVSKEEYEQRVTGDHLQTMRTEMLVQPGSLFAERFQEQVIPKQDMEIKVDEAYRKAFRKKSLSSAGRGKRADSAAKKLVLQKHLRQEQTDFLAYRENLDTEIRERLVKNDLLQMDTLYQDRETIAAVSEWLVVKKQRGAEIDHSLLMEDRNMLQTLHVRLAEFQRLDPVELFAYESDREFVSEFAKKYDQLTKYAALEPLYLKYEALMQGESARISASKVRANIQYCKEMKNEYETRMALIQSPYYALLSSGDLADYASEKGIAQLKKEGADAMLIKTVTLYKELSESPLGKSKGKKKAKDRYSAVLKEQQKRCAEKDKEHLENLLKGIKVPDYAKEIASAEKRKDKPLFRGICRDASEKVYPQMVEKYKKDYPKDDLEFLEKVPFHVEFQTFDGCDDEQVMTWEYKLFDLVRYGNILGFPVQPPVDQEVQKCLKEFFEIRRDYMASMEAVINLMLLAGGAGADIQNPELMNTKLGKQLAVFLTGHDSKGGYGFDEVSNLYAALRNDYRRALINIFAVLTEHHYEVDTKHEPMLKDPQKITEAVAAGKEHYLKRHPGEDDFPKVTVDGKEYTSYIDNTNFWPAIGKSFETREEDRQMVAETFQAYEDYTKQLMVNQELLLTGEDGMGITKAVLAEGLKRQIKPVEERVQQIMSKYGYLG